MTRRDNITRWRAKGLWMDVFQLLRRKIRCQFAILARKDEATPDYAAPLRFHGEIRCQFAILARKDEATPDYADTGLHRYTQPDISSR